MTVVRILRASELHNWQIKQDADRNTFMICIKCNQRRAIHDDSVDGICHALNPKEGA